MLKDWQAEAVVPVGDLDRAARFYRDFMGLTIERDVEPGVIAVHAGGDSVFHLQLSGQPPRDTPVLVFHVADLAPEVASLRHEGVTFVRADGSPAEEPVSQPGGVRLALLRDSEGNILELRED